MNHEDLMPFIKVAGANFISWAATYIAVVKVADIGAIVSILAGLGSVGVSIVSIIWIRKQTVVFDREHKDNNAPRP